MLWFIGVTGPSQNSLRYPPLLLLFLSYPFVTYLDEFTDFPFNFKVVSLIRVQSGRKFLSLHPVSNFLRRPKHVNYIRNRCFKFLRNRMAMKRVDKYLQKYISLNPLPKTYLVSQFVSAAEVTAQCDTEGLIHPVNVFQCFQ